jgi:disulfide bond formation protein DsbB
MPDATAKPIYVIIQLGISIAVLLGAYGFEILGGLAPCQLCYYQRAPYFLAIIVCAIAWLYPRWMRTLLAMLVAIYLISVGLGIYHAGVEWKFWPGPASCTAMGNSNIPVEELMAQILAAPIVRCDEIPWSLFGISLAGYNALISIGLLAMAVGAFMQELGKQRNGRT